MDAMKISRLSWRVLLHRARTNLEPLGHLPRIACLGVGNELNGDDVAGLWVVRFLKQINIPAQRCLLLETGSSPENFTAPVTRFAPDWVLVVDAARMQAQPGRIAYAGLADVTGVSAFTHGLPLSMLGEYLVAETGCQFGLLGIQVAQTGFGVPISATVERAARRLGQELAVLFTQNNVKLKVMAGQPADPQARA
jgi:hydrogenase 3 maturation protease